MENVDFELPKRLCFDCGKCNGNKPKSAFSEIPDGCGYEGWIFCKREEHKQKVRKIDEELILIDVKIKNAKGHAKKQKYEKAREKILAKLEELKNFGPIDF